ncbi:Agrin, partial [Geodia barretti]
MRQAAVRSSFLHRLCKSALFLTLLPLLVHSQGSDTVNSNCNRNCDGHELDQVCASNGVTYDNRCEMELAACRENIELVVRDNGPCNEPVALIKSG